MLWLILSLLTALAVATQDAWVKRFFSHLNAFEMATVPMVYSFPMFAVTLLFIAVPDLDGVFFAAFLVSLPLNGVCFVLYMRAIRLSPLSLTVPFLAFTPVFMLATGWLFLNEVPNGWGIAGVLLTATGSYVLYSEEGGQALLDPFRAMGREPGAMPMLLVAFLFSFAAVIGKVGILHSSVMFFTFSFFAVLNPLMAAVLVASGLSRPSILVALPGKGMAAGLLLYLHALCHGWAISLTKAVYMIAVKRLSILFGVMYGGVVFREENIATRAMGAALMVAGAGIIMVLGR